MEAKLIKTQEGYILEDTNKNPIGQTFGKFQGKRLSLKNCQAIELGYDLDELAEKHYDLHIKRGHTEEDSLQRKIDFILGFVSALEILGDKKFSEKDVYLAINLAWDDDNLTTLDIIQELQQTEWDVIVEMEDIDKIELSRGATSIEDSDYILRTQYIKLDADGCLILKRK